MSRKMFMSSLLQQHCWVMCGAAMGVSGQQLDRLGRWDLMVCKDPLLFQNLLRGLFERRPEIRHIGSGELGADGIRQSQSGVLGDMSLAVDKVDEVRGFSPQLGWSHYQVFLRLSS
jgi:hypothetical protein